MTSIRSYVVRIYRSSRAGMTGVVEDVQTGRTQPFSSVTELWQALRKRSPRPVEPRPGEPQPPPSENPSDASPD
ncbi:MAG TPA: hypothetical protein VJ484_13775 [Lysobacter sp.]|nr:hypothetical protein [Lysobacter sp.]